MITDYDLNDIVEMKKEHPCHKSKYWKIIRMGADIKIKCLGCGAAIMFPRSEFERKCKKLIEKADKAESNPSFLPLTVRCILRIRLKKGKLIKDFRGQLCLRSRVSERMKNLCH